MSPEPRARVSTAAPPPDVAPVLVFDALAEERPGGGSPGPAARVTRPGTRRVRATERRLRRAIAVVAAAVVVVVAALIGSVLTHGGTTSVTSVAHGAPAGGTPLSSTAPATDSTTTAAPSVATAPPPPGTTATAAGASPTPPAAAGPPVLTKLRPDSGVPGQSVDVRGSGFLSASGHISATVGGRTASVRCPDQTNCSVTIPPVPGRRSMDPVVIITDGGASNPLAFVLR